MKQKIALSELKLNDGTHGLPKNPRFIRDERFKKLVESIKDFPEAMPARGIVVDENGVILGGNMRYRVCQELGMKEIPAAWVYRLAGLTTEQKRRFIIMDNRPFGDDDFDLLANEWDIAELITAGFDEKDLEGLVKDEPQDTEAQVDRAAELNKTWKVKAGDLWQIGNHRLLCGDSTKAEDVARVMGGEKADMVFTDPPYGIGRDIKNDDLCGKEFNLFNTRWIQKIPVKNNSGMVCYHSTRTFPSVLNSAVREGWTFERMLWYYRPDKFPTHSWKHWMMVSQAIMLFSFGDVEYADTESDQDCYRLTSSNLGDGHGHPTEKMAEHSMRIMRHFKADIVYDPFLGSGTTMVAAENLGRKCYGIEISAPYCSVVLQRMFDAFPGIKIERIK